MTLAFVGLGLFDEKDISIRGLEAVREADCVFAEFYTSKLFGASKEDFEELLGKEIRVLSRNQVEQKGLPLERAKEGKDVAFLVPGDPMISTTHVDLKIEAMESEIETRIIHGASIFTAAPGLCGLQNYKFGRSATVTFKTRGSVPASSYNAVRENKKDGLHTLLFLDIDDEDDRYMSPDHALNLLMEIEEEKQQGVLAMADLCVVVSRAGSPSQSVRVGEVGDLIDEEFGDPLHTLIFPGELHFREREALEAFGDW